MAAPPVALLAGPAAVPKSGGRSTSGGGRQEGARRRTRPGRSARTAASRGRRRRPRRPASGRTCAARRGPGRGPRRRKPKSPPVRAQRTAGDAKNGTPTVSFVVCGAAPPRFCCSLPRFCCSPKVLGLGSKKFWITQDWPQQHTTFNRYESKPICPFFCHCGFDYRRLFFAGLRVGPVGARGRARGARIPARSTRPSTPATGPGRDVGLLGSVGINESDTRNQLLQPTATSTFSVKRYSCELATEDKIRWPPKP